MAVLSIRRVLLIVNPASRRGRRRRLAAERAFAAEGIACDVRITTRSGHATELARDLGARYDAIFTLGGDGTAMEVADALSGSGRLLGVLAGGTGNLLVRALGIPMSPGRAVRALVGGDVLRIDLGRFAGGHRFAIAAGVGIDAAMVAETPAWLKRRLGVLAYTIMGTRAALRAVLRREFFRVRVTVDDTQYEGMAAAVMIANFGAVLNDRITLGPGIRYDDGVLDVCLYAPRTLGDALRITWRLLRRDFRSDAAMIYRSGRRIRVETDPPYPVQADGELLGETPFEVVVEPHAASLLVPRRG